MREPLLASAYPHQKEAETGRRKRNQEFDCGNREFVQGICGNLTLLHESLLRAATLKQGKPWRAVCTANRVVDEVEVRTDLGSAREEETSSFRNAPETGLDNANHWH